MTMRRALIAGNWKMHGRRSALGEIEAVMSVAQKASGVDVAFCPPAVYVAAAVGLGIGDIGGQDCSVSQGDAARTGEVSAAMLADCGAKYVIVGHSERRAYHGESDEIVRAKAEAGLAAGLVPIVCVGETLDQREAGDAETVVSSQIAESIPVGGGGDGEIVLAYEPVWAIGTGRVPQASDIASMHAAARAALAKRAGAEMADRMRILYGGSVKGANAGEIFAVEGVDGALVGGASLKSDDFLAIIRAHPASGL